jgi:arginine decarboxylase
MTGMHDRDITYISTDYSEKFNLFMPVSTSAVIEHLDSNLNIQFLVITSPTYEGLSADIVSIGAACLERNVKLVIDNSHGSLFPFDTTKFAPSGLGINGVDAVI